MGQERSLVQRGPGFPKLTLPTTRTLHAPRPAWPPVLESQTLPSPSWAAAGDLGILSPSSPRHGPLVLPWLLSAGGTQAHPSPPHEEAQTHSEACPVTPNLLDTERPSPFGLHHAPGECPVLPGQAPPSAWMAGPVVMEWLRSEGPGGAGRPQAMGVLVTPSSYVKLFCPN